MNLPTCQEIIDYYGLIPHPEGGFYKETYRSEGKISIGQNVERSFSTAIYYLLPQGQKSSWHRLSSDEVWHFYLGGPLEIYQIDPRGKRDIFILGPDVRSGQSLQWVVPAHHWFGSKPCPGTEFSFVGCTVAPGFDFADFELMKKNNQDPLFSSLEMKKFLLHLEN